MNLLFFTLGISLSIIYCKAVILDYSNITPWRVAYAVYPVYNPEPWINVWRNHQPAQSWVQVWKNDRSWDIFDNAINVRFNEDRKIDNNLKGKVADFSDSHPKSQQPEKSTETKNLKSKQPPNYSWPRNDKDWEKKVKKDHAPL